MKYLKFYPVVFFSIMFYFGCAESKHFDFWSYKENNELKKALFNEINYKNDKTAVEDFIKKNIGIFSNSKIIRTNENAYGQITLLLTKENYIKLIAGNNDYYSSIIIEYIFDENKKLKDISVEISD